MFCAGRIASSCGAHVYSRVEDEGEGEGGDVVVVLVFWGST